MQATAYSIIPSINKSLSVKCSENLRNNQNFGGFPACHDDGVFRVGATLLAMVIEEASIPDTYNRVIVACLPATLALNLDLIRFHTFRDPLRKRRVRTKSATSFIGLYLPFPKKV